MQTRFSILLLSMALPLMNTRAGNTWDGGGGDNLWSNSLNWTGDTPPGYGTLVFDGVFQTTNVIDAVFNMNQVNWNGAMPWVLNSSGAGHLMLYDNGGTQAKLENFGTVAVTINAPITFAATAGANFGEINAVTGSMNFTGGTLTVNGSAVSGIKFWGSGANDVSFGNTVDASGKWFGFTSTNPQSVTIASGANVTTGDWFVMNGGTLKLAGGTLTTSAVRLGGDFGTTGNQNQTLGGTLALTAPTGGISLGGTINAVSGNTSNALLISSQNATGTNTLTGSIFLDSDLKIQQMPGAALTTSTGTFDVKAQKLTVEAGAMSTVTISQALTSSLGAGGYLVKEGNGTLVLSSTSNNYTGTSAGSLNANGTQIFSGTLAIAGDGSLGVVPSSAYNNLQFTGSGTLRADATMTLNANRSVSIANSQTGTFDSNGNTLRINGIISGSGNLAATGAGTVTLAANNTYSGSTNVAIGTTLRIGAGGSTGSLGSGSVVNDGEIIFDRTASHTLSNAMSGTGALTKLNANTLFITGTKSYTGSTTISAGTLSIGNPSVDGGTEIITYNNGALSPSSDIVNNATLRFARQTANQGTHFGTISGTGDLRVGYGAVRLDDASNSFSGKISIIPESGIGNNPSITFNSIGNVGGGPSALGAPTTVSSGTIDLGTTSQATAKTSSLIYYGSGHTSDRVLNLSSQDDDVKLSHIGSGLLKFTSDLTATGAGSKLFELNASSAATGELAGAIPNNSSVNLTSVSKTGSGVWILSGENTYTGSTTISTGTMQVGNGGTSGSISPSSNISISTGARLAFNRSDTVTQGTHFETSLSGGGALRQDGSGTLILTGTNSYSGGTTINAGTLQLGNGGSSGSLGSGSITNNGTLAVNRSDTVTFTTDITGTGGFEQMGPGTTVFVGSKGYEGNTLISGGTLQLGSGGTFGQAGLLGSITNNGALVLSYTGVAGLFSQTVSGSGTLTKSGSGSVQILGGLNTFSGLTTIEAGTLEVLTDNAMGSTAAGTVVQDGATLWLKNHYNAAEPLTLNGTGDGGAGALRTSSGYNVSYAGPITTGSNATISVTDSLTLTGGIAKGDHVLTLVGGGTLNVNTNGITGSGAFPGILIDGTTVNFNASNDFTGHLALINGSTLHANHPDALSGSNRVIVTMDHAGHTTGSTLRLGASQEIGALDGTPGTFLDLQGHSLTIGRSPGTFVSFRGVISGVGGSLVKDGTSEQLILGTSNTYSGGTTLAGGTLVINGDQSLGAVPFTSQDTVFFTGNATLRLGFNVSSVALAATRGIHLSGGVTGRFEAAQTAVGIEGIISGGGAAVFALPSGYVGLGLTLDGANTYEGLTTITGGVTVHANTDNALGSADAGTVVDAGSALILNNVAYATAEPLTLNGTGISNGGAFSASGTSSFAGPITIASDASIRTNGTLNLTGGLVKDGTTLTLTSMGGGTFNINTTGISGSSANSDLIVDGSTVNLNAASSYNGPTFVQNGGTLNANVTGALPTAPRSAVHLDMTGSGSSTLALGASQEAEFVSGVLSSTIALGSHTLTVGSTLPSNAPFSGVISGTGSIVKDGTNGWTLFGTSNTYFGSTTLAGGTLGIAGDGSLGAYPASPENKIFFTGNATLQDAVNHVTLGANRGISIASGVTGTFDATGNTFTIGGSIVGDGNLASAGNVVLTGANSYAGTTTVNSGVLSIGAGGTTGSLGAGDVTIQSGGELRFNRSNAYSYGGSIGGAGNLRQSGGGISTLSGSSSYTGTTFVDAGILEITANNALGTTAGGTQVTGLGAQLRLNNVNYSTAEPLTLSSGTLSNVGSSTFAGPVQVSGNSIVELGFSNAYTLNLSGGVSLDTGSSLRVGGIGQATVAGITGDSTATVRVIDHTTRLVLSAPSSFEGTFTFGSNSQINTTIQLATAGAFSGPNYPSFQTENPLSGGTLDLNGYSATIADIVYLGSVTNTQAATTSTLTLAGSSPSEMWYSLKDGAGVLAITRAGSGNLTVIGNTYSGLTTIQSGSITTSFGGLGSAASGTVVNSGGALILLSDTTYTTPEPLTLNGTGISNGGAFSSSGTSSFAGPITIASNATIRNTGTLTLTGGLVKDGTTLTLAGSGTFNINTIGISGSSPNSDLVVDGATVVLNAMNSYNGPTTVQNSGTLKLGMSSVMPIMPHSALSLVTGGTFDLNSASDTIASLNGTGSVINGGPTMSSLTVGGSNGSGSFSGVISGDLSLNKTGSGIQTLSGANTYDGTIAITTVTQGTLNATNTTGSATGGTTVVIDPTGTLAGTGAIAPASGKSVYLNGTFIVGDATLGTPVASEFGITTTGGGTMNVGSTATLKFDLFTGAGLGNNNAIPTAADILTLQGDATFATGSILEIGNPNAMSGWLVGDSWRIWDTSGAGTLSGVLAVVGPNLGGAGFWDFNMASGILSIVAVPEPSRALLGLVGLACVMTRRRRQAR